VTQQFCSCEVLYKTLALGGEFVHCCH